MELKDGPDDIESARQQIEDSYDDIEYDNTLEWQTFQYVPQYDLQAPKSMSLRFATAVADRFCDGTFLGRCVTYGEHVRGDVSGDHPRIHGPADGCVVILNRDAVDTHEELVAVLRHELAHLEQLYRDGSTHEQDEAFVSLCKRLDAPHPAYSDSVTDY